MSIPKDVADDLLLRQHRIARHLLHLSRHSNDRAARRFLRQQRAAYEQADRWLSEYVRGWVLAGMRKHLQ